MNILTKFMHYAKEKNDQKLIKKLEELKSREVNLLIIGGTGVGKSSTINALFGKDIAKVGDNPAPETMEITKYELDNNITLWDSPGLGDGIKDIQHKEKIISLLASKDENDKNVIDCILVISAANSKDLGTTYDLINNVLIPNIDEPHKKIIVAINKADEVINPRYWKRDRNEPSQEQINWLEEKVDNVQTRIYESTQVKIKRPIYYAAGYNDENFSDPAYNIDNLMIYILKSIPKEKAVNTMEEFGENITDSVVDTGIAIISGLFDLGKGIIKGIFKLFE